MQVMESEGYKYMITTCPQLQSELLQARIGWAGVWGGWSREEGVPDQDGCRLTTRRLSCIGTADSWPPAPTPGLPPPPTQVIASSAFGASAGQAARQGVATPARQPAALGLPSDERGHALGAQGPGGESSTEGHLRRVRLRRE